MGNITESIDVEVPIDVVYNQWTQFESFPQFMSGVDSIQQLDDKRLHWVTSIGGITREFDALITEQHPEERVAWTTKDGPKHAGVITFHRLGQTTTRVTAQMDIDAEGLAETVADKTGLIDHQVKGDLKRFKTFIEARGQETGGWQGNVDRPGA